MFFFIFHHPKLKNGNDYGLLCRGAQPFYKNEKLFNQYENYVILKMDYIGFYMPKVWLVV